MILAVIPLIPLAWAGGAAVTAGIVGWANGRSKRRKELKEQEKENQRMKNELMAIAARQKQHEDDLNGVIANQETGQTAEEEEFGIFPEQSAPEQIKETTKDDDYEGDDRFELLDL